MQLNNIGIAGEFRCVVYREDGSVKKDTGYQKNLILNQGLEFFGGNKGPYINERCVIGSGNSAPDITQNKLDAFIAIVIGTDITSNYGYVDKGDGMYRMWEQRKYRFTELNNVNISEVGLVSNGTTSANYYLTTRALIKDESGNPTSITVMTGETLDIYYKIHKIVDVTDKNYVINVLDNNGGSIPYNVVIRPINVGSFMYATTYPTVSITYNNRIDFFLSDKELEPITTGASTTESGQGFRADTYVKFRSYTANTFKRILDVDFGLNLWNDKELRKISFVKSGYGQAFEFLPFQMRIGRVSDDAPLIKTDKESLLVPFEVSWGRYEGEL